MGGERSRSTCTLAAEFDGPSHFLTSWAPTTGATLLNCSASGRGPALLGHALVTMPYLGAGGPAPEREQDLRGKLAHCSNCVQTPPHAHKQYEKLI